MDKKFEKVVARIMKECEADGEPVTREEAEEMARMEIKANGTRHREESENYKEKKKPKERKVDAEKGHLLGCMKTLLEGLHAEITSTKTETELSFIYNGNNYTLKLTKHRPPRY